MNDSEITVSVVLPVYNAERYVQKSIDSVLAQTEGNFELIIVDDCSRDGSYALLRENAVRDRRIRLLKNEVNQGVAVCRNRAIAAARGTYTAFLDSDDIWEPEKLHLQLELLQKTGGDLACSAYDLIDQAGNPVLKPHRVPERLDYDMILRENCILCSSVCVRTALLKAHPFRQTYYHEDYVLWLELLRVPVKAVGNQQVLVHYRISPGSRSCRKGHAALHRWRIYRGFLRLNPVKSAFYFVQYAAHGIRKYYL